MLFRNSVCASSWSTFKADHLAKGPRTTTWLWNLHALPHDFSSSTSSAGVVTRKVLSSNLAHLSLVSIWSSCLLLHGGYLSNFSSWLSSPRSVRASAQQIWSILGQESLNSDLGHSTNGIQSTSGLFNLWLSQGIISSLHLKYSAIFMALMSFLFIMAAYVVMHVIKLDSLSVSLSPGSGAICLGLASVLWSGHLIHISIPTLAFLTSGTAKDMIPSPSTFLSSKESLSVSLYNSMHSFGTLSKSSLFLTSSLEPTTGSVNLSSVALHHFFLGLVLILVGICLLKRPRKSNASSLLGVSSSTNWHYSLAYNLLFLSAGTLLYSNSVYNVPVYPYLVFDYPAMICLFTHHMWIGFFLLVGCFAHFSIGVIRSVTHKNRYSLFYKALIHRDLVLGHLCWLVLFLGFHSFGILIHNDTLQALSRSYDSFSDSSIQLKPFFANLSYSFLQKGTESVQNYVLGSYIGISYVPVGTNDFILFHIHAFTLHTTFLILIKSALYSRSSRLVADKKTLGFRFPCDGPGRGGTCQISSWDHIFLSLFWMYNGVSVIIFHYSWKMQSCVWGTVGSSNKVSHLSSSDYLSNSNSVNGWLRSFLWSQSSQVIQSYSTSLAAYGLLFLAGHFIWSFSLMFLFSGRGYWQELIEAILWSHYKLRVFPTIQPRALSISQGRAVGVVHYLLGGILCTWSFFISRLIALS